MDDRDANAARIVALAALLVFALVQATMLASGFLLDDLNEAFAGREATVAQIARLEPAPSLLPLLLWKAAVALSPEQPQLPMRLLYAALHVLNAWLVLRLFAPLVGRPLAWIGAGAFLLFRPAATTLLWVSAGKETLLLTLSLAALLAWRRGARWLALVPAALAMASKPSVVLLPLVLGAWTLWLEPRGPERRRALAPLALLALANALLALNAVMRPGWWGVFEPGGGAPWPEKIDLVGKTLVRSFAIVWPDHVLPFAGTGWLALAAAGLLAAFAPARVRFGLVWAVAFLAPPILAAGITNPHYTYLAGVGTLLVCAVGLASLATTGARGRAAASALACVWILAHAAFIAKDANDLRACHELGVATRVRMAERTEATCPGCRIAVVNRPLLVNVREIARYDRRAEIELEPRSTCVGATGPCLVFREKVHMASQCPRGDAESFVRWSDDPPAGAQASSDSRSFASTL